MTRNGGLSIFRRFLVAVSSLGILTALGLQLFVSPDASEELRYTASVMLKVWLPIFLVILLLASGLSNKLSGGKLGWAILFFIVLTFALFMIPILSPEAFYLSWKGQLGLSICWGFGFFCAGVLFFMIAARLGSLGSWANCLVGSIFLGLGIGEFWFLLTDQPADWLVEDQYGSKYLQAGALPFNRNNWEIRQCGSAPVLVKGGYQLAHRQLRKDVELFDAKYGMSGQGRRVLPAASGPIDNELLLFGCSFTFGHALNDDETWPYLLARDLGPTWKVENYAQSGYGLMQTLCMVENHLLEPVSAKNRVALFLAIRHQVLRNDFFLSSPHYILDSSGQPQRQGEARYGWITRLGQNFNGSQLAREVGSFLTAMLAKDNAKFRNDYLAMLAKTRDLLKRDYNVDLTALLWPDMEDLAPDLEKLHISYIMIRSMLPNWDKSNGKEYLVRPPYEVHPNALAAALIAAGLAEKLRAMSAAGEASLSMR